MEYRAGRWILRYQTPPGQHLIAAAPAGNLVIVLFSTALRQYDPANGTWTPWKSPDDTRLGAFTAMTARGPDFWISGERGLARLRVAEHGPPQWTEISGAGAGLSDFRYPVAGREGEMFAQAKAGAGAVAVVRWSPAGLEKVYVSSDGAPRGWRGPDGSVWILEGAALFRLSEGGRTPVPRDGVLSGSVFDIYSEDGKSFWLAGSEGVARYAPLLWQAPEGLNGLDLPVHAAFEDRQGRLWFAATDYLLELDGEVWKRHRIPSGLRTHATQTASVMESPNGRIVVNCLAQDQTDIMLEFDPLSGGFHDIRPPEGRQIVLMAPRKSGGLWAATMANGVPGFRLEIYDGKGLTPFLDLGREWHGGDLRSIMERPERGVLVRRDQWRLPVQRRSFYPSVCQGSRVMPTAAPSLSLSCRMARLMAGGREGVFHWTGSRWKQLRGGLDRVRSFVQTKAGCPMAGERQRSVPFDRRRLDRSRSGGRAAFEDRQRTIFQDSRGRIWAGTTRGLAVYHPDADHDPPMTVLEGGVDPREVPSSGDVRFGFSGVDRWKQTTAERLLFSYRLDQRRVVAVPTR